MTVYVIAHTDGIGSLDVIGVFRHKEQAEEFLKVYTYKRGYEIFEREVFEG